MKFSIITVVYNGEEFIKDCIESVLSQDYKNIEYIVIDGGSTDKTPEIISSFGNSISIFISEKDNGLYYAMNKGITMATGDIIGLLNADDLYYDKDVIKNVADVFAKNDTSAVYGNAVFIKRDDTHKDKIVRYWKSKKMYPGYFEDGEIPHHLSLFIKKDVYKKFGTINTQYNIAADYELMLRFFKVNKVTAFYYDRILTKIRLGGLSNGSIRNIMKGNFEILKAWRNNGLPIPWVCLFIKRPLNKIKQYLFNPFKRQYSS
ncbi:MAG TPA: glycosyltransferase family 2 protein [Ignavibacteria bacterium]|nr:glycosyltransferase family 2 protein [Ignavibacteria bacterium]